MEIWNPWHGCRKYSEGCENCYMYYLDEMRDKSGSDIYRVKTDFNLPLKKKRTGEYKVTPGTVLHVCLTSDFFLEEADPWRSEVWEIIKQRRDVEFRILTKRAFRIEKCLPDDWGTGYDNVTLSVTCETQKRADERIPILLKIPAKKKGIMTAPILEEIHIERYLDSGKISFVICDGENYAGSRPCRYEWVKSLYDQCVLRKCEFEFVGTGNVFIKDGKTYNICKAYQKIEARRSGLSYPPIDTNVPIMKKCATCERNSSCNGCKMCGRCYK